MDAGHDNADDLVLRPDLRPRLAARGLLRPGRQLALLSGAAFTVPAGMVICSLEIDADGAAWGCAIGTAKTSWAENVRHAFAPASYIHSAKASSHRLPWRTLLHDGRSWCLSRISSVSPTGLVAELLDFGAQTGPTPRASLNIACVDFAAYFPTVERLS